MTQGSVLIRTPGPVGGESVRVAKAQTFRQRLVGLLGRRSLAADEALLITRCNSVHTVGMRFTIDVVFLSREGVVLRVRSALAPWSAASCLRADSVLELSAGEARRRGIEPGLRLDLWPQANLPSALEPVP